MTKRPLLHVAGSHVSKFVNLNVSGTNRDIVPKQRSDRFPSVNSSKKYNKIWEKVKELLEIDFKSKPVYGDDDKYIKTK